MKLKTLIQRSIAIACLWILLNNGLANARSPIPISNNPSSMESVATLVDAARKPQALDGKKLQQSLDRADLVDAIRQVELGWQFQYESYYQGKLKSQYLELPEIQQQLTKINRSTATNSALIYAIPRPDGLNLILVSAQGSPVYKKVKEANAQTLPAVIKELRTNIVNPQTFPLEYLPPAQQLDRWSIQPLVADLEARKIDTILFCLGTGLRGLPLAALHDGERFLVERYNFAIIPAFNLLDRQSQKIKGTQVLAMGAAKFTDNANLPAVPLELAAITQPESWSGKVLLNESFTLSRLQQMRSQNPYGIVHLATHANISAKSVQDSYIQFWDRRLQLNQLRELRLDNPAVQLLVLSACRTALGTPNAELGFAGLAVQSGAKSVLASLWAVDDAGTLVLMSDFYQQLKTAPLKANALRNTQIAMLKGQLKLSNNPIVRRSRGSLPTELKPLLDRDLSHPYFWAAFTAIGNPW